MARDDLSLLRAKRKRQQKIIYWILVVALAVGLVGSSVAWSIGGSSKVSQTSGQGQQQINPQQVLKDLEAKAKANPKDTGVLMQLADTYGQFNQNDKAVAAYQKILELNPKDTKAGIALTKKYFQMSKYDEAENQVKNVLKLEPNNQEAHEYYGLILGYGKKDYQGGIAELQKYVELAKTGKDVESVKYIIKDWQTKVQQKQ